ncbi:uncharacterized protein LOC132719009 isoform X2 [Ruditapes philippinarum]|uniref:uncharacterized protein LOC132719009 isoform X2 n=1 Tax=Ruditapes philippinarum TaxID=129788 RepID=UPI00295BC849|nr:uncharacterized protein LOC132719009 isoform X2 [Ruditapes philippinarum]
MTSQENKMASSRTDAREMVQKKYHFSGANSLQKLEDVIFQHEKRTNSLFVKVKTTNKLKLPVHSELVSKKRVFWEEHSSQILPLPFDGVPFIVVGRQVRECSHGPDRHKSAKCKSKKEKEAEKV